MTLKTGREYIASIEALGLEANILGKKSADLTADPLVRPSLQAVAATFDGAHSQDHRSLWRVPSSLTGEEINRFNHLHQSTADLTNKVIMP